MYLKEVLYVRVTSHIMSISHQHNYYSKFGHLLIVMHSFWEHMCCTISNVPTYLLYNIPNTDLSTLSPHGGGHVHER